MNKSVDMHHPEQRRLASIAAYNRVGLASIARARARTASIAAYNRARVVLASIARAWVGLASITACNSPGHPDIHT